MKVGIGGHCLVMVGIDGHFVEVAEVVGCWEEEVEEGEVEGDQKEGEAGCGEEEEEEEEGEVEGDQKEGEAGFGEEEEVGYLVVVGEFVGVGG